MDKTEDQEDSRQKGHRGPYRKYSLEDKQLAIQYMTEFNYPVLQVSKILGINPKNIRRWMEKGITKKTGQGRKTSDPSMEKRLFQMITDHQRDHSRLPPKQTIVSFAKEHSQQPGFKASKGWFDKFVKRYGFKLKQFRVNRKRITIKKEAES